MKIRLEIIMYKHGFEMYRKVFRLKYTLKQILTITKTYFDKFQNKKYDKLKINIKIGKYV